MIDAEGGDISARKRIFIFIYFDKVINCLKTAQKMSLLPTCRFCELTEVSTIKHMYIRDYEPAKENHHDQVFK